MTAGSSPSTPRRALPIPASATAARFEMTPHLGREVIESRTTHSSPPAICGNTVIVGSIVADFATHKEAPPASCAPTTSLPAIWHGSSHHPPGGRTRRRDLGGGVLALQRQHERLVDDRGRRGSGNRLPAHRHADERSLRRPPPRRQPLRGEHRGGRLRDRWSAVHYQFVITACGTTTHRPPRTCSRRPSTASRCAASPQATKQAFAFVFDRTKPAGRCGRSRKGGASQRRAGRARGADPAVPYQPAAFDRQGITEDDLIDWTPELRAEALEIVAEYDLVPLYTPPRIEGTGKPTVQLPADGGGRELDRRRGRSRNRDPLRGVAHPAPPASP